MDTVKFSTKFSDIYSVDLRDGLGEGSYARVFHGIHLQSEDPVAVKIISKSLVMHSDSIHAMLRREVEHHIRIRHRYILTLRDVFESPKFVFLVLDRCDCGNLADMLQLRRKLNEDETKWIAYQLMSALKHMHTECGTMHCDIKPANILFHRQRHSSLEFDLLYEKRMRERKMVISLMQAPIVEKKDAFSDSDRISGEDIMADLPLACKDLPGAVVCINGEWPSYVPPPHVSLGSRAPKRSKKIQSENRFFRSDSMSSEASSGSGEKPGVKIRYKCPYGLVVNICDFGQCRKVPDIRYFQYTKSVHKAPYSKFGTEGFLAPELLQEQPYGTAVDMWAVGAVLYMCISGNLPFVPARQCLSREARFTGYLWDQVSSAAKEFIGALLHSDENSRMTAAEAMNHVWFNDISLILEGRPPIENKLVPGPRSFDSKTTH
jgi:serine/threonine protein kinase